MCGLKDVWPPFMWLATFMFAHWWMFPCGMVATIIAHWFIVDQENFDQHMKLKKIRERANAPKRKR